ncbi:CBS domain-containing protein [Lysobacter sp. GX 14042]|uniref:HlyC/CorC family transporter n=1 Tax=Lysobacter sp. GX 14042 TaxID=2907155 RepID=UPI001F37098B|nr:transporter associated domain-containing protein [Lysobacter sp. GX 14042]MCE7031807.1 CBS domain-containing protein [Lysobacter sp. GX 14042]
MSEDDSSHPPPTNGAPERLQDKRRSWFDRISSALSGEPSNREDLVELLRDAQADGLIEADTLTMMEGAIAVSDLSVGDVMIPRSQMVMLPAEAPMDELLALVVESGHSRFPVHGDDKDQIIGILLAKDLLRRFANGGGRLDLHALLRPAVLIPESKRLDVLLREFRQSRNHMAIVVDEYGGVAGLLTIEDVLEQIVGEIDDEHDDAEDPNAMIAAQADGQFVVDALTPIEDFNERFRADFDDDEYDTIGGLVTGAIGHLPEAGEQLTLSRFVFRVASADARRVHAFHVSVLGDG